MEKEIEEVPYDEQRLRDADPDDLYLFMLEPYPYMMTPDQVADFTGSTGQEIRTLLNRGDIQGCRIGIKWCVPKLGLLNYLNKNRKAGNEIGDEEAQMRQTV